MNNFKPHLYKKEKIKAKYKVNLIKKLKIFLNLYVQMNKKFNQLMKLN